MVPVWNSLPNEAVMADNINILRIVLTSSGHHMILFIYLELSHLKPEELHNFSQSLFAFLYFNFFRKRRK